MCTAFFVLGGECGDDAAADDADGAPSTSTTSTPPSLSLLLLFNRDEFLDRETEPAAFWTDHPHVLAGRDLRRGGTWVGVTRAGRFALLTNFREPNFSGAGPDAPSRGVLPTDFLTGHQTPLEYLEGLVSAGGLTAHNGFNLVVGCLIKNSGHRRTCQAAYLTNRGPAGAPGHGQPTPLSPGVYGLSNGPLGRWSGRSTGWAKVDAGVAALRALVSRGGVLAASVPPSSPADLPWPILFGTGLMGCATRSPPDALPVTGVPVEYEEALSSTFIPPTRNLFGHGTGMVYGTRSQTGLAVYSDGRAVLVERSAEVEEEEDGGGGGGGGDKAAPATTASPTPVPVAWREVVHEFVVEEGGVVVGAVADAATEVVVDEAGGCASGPEEEAGLVVGGAA